VSIFGESNNRAERYWLNVILNNKMKGFNEN